MNVNYSEYSDIGGRRVNEDMVQITCHPDCVLAMVADGLGGHGNGDVASRLAVSTISEVTRNGAASPALATEAILAAHARVVRAQQEQQKSMKTTVSLLWLNAGQACAAHVGDTRIYQFRQGRIIYQSRDHSVPQMEVDLGHITPDQIRGHADRNRLLRALGSKQEPKVEAVMLPVEQGDAFLLCSDGFWELVLEQEMLSTLVGTPDAKTWLRDMLSLVASRIVSNSDNNTAIALIVQ